MTKAQLAKLGCTAALAVVGFLSTATPAFAQDPGGAPPPAAGGTVAATTANLAAPKGADDMTGSLGFGVGVIPNAQLVGTSGQVAVKYWMKDTLAIVPALNFTLTKVTGSSTGWAFSPEGVALFVPFQSTSTRLLVGGGLGISLSKAATPSGAPSSDTVFRIYLPIQAGVEHFFTRWFSTGIAARTNFVDYTKVGSTNQFGMSINTASLLGSLFFYTD
jgi:hypothetical protein